MQIKFTECNGVYWVVTSNPQMQMQIKLQVVTEEATVSTMTTVTMVGHKAHLMSQIDSAQRRRDKSFKVIENKTYKY